VYGSSRRPISAVVSRIEKTPALDPDPLARMGGPRSPSIRAASPTSKPAVGETRGGAEAGRGGARGRSRVLRDPFGPAVDVEAAVQLPCRDGSADPASFDDRGGRRRVRPFDSLLGDRQDGIGPGTTLIVPRHATRTTGSGYPRPHFETEAFTVALQRPRGSTHVEVFQRRG